MLSTPLAREYDALKVSASLDDNLVVEEVFSPIFSQKQANLV